MPITFSNFDDKDSVLWDELNNSSDNSTFLTSTHWINFQKTLGKDIEQFLIKDENNPIGILYIEKYKRSKAKFAYSPYNPVLKSALNEDQVKEVWESIKVFMKEYIDQNGLTLFRMDPYTPKNNIGLFLKLDFKSSLAPTQAKDMWVIDLTKPEDELRAAMSSSTRHNINKGLKSEMVIEKAENSFQVKEFGELMGQTTTRKGFSNFDTNYFVKQFDALHSKGRTDVYLARYQGKAIAGALINYHKDTVYYTHGASTSDRELSKLRAPYPLQWTIMKECKQKGFKKYNMWGVLPENAKNNTMKGVSDFKKSFGGEIINLVGGLEIYNNPVKYNMHRLLDWWAYRKDRY